VLRELVGGSAGACACASVSVWAVVIEVCECVTVVEVGVCARVVESGLCERLCGVTESV
jgi:hypothetical protein